MAQRPERTPRRQARRHGQSTADLVYERTRLEIVMGRLAPGTLIDEISLANQFRVSRTPIREALRRLEQDGLVHTLPRRGTLVRRPTLQDLVDIDQIRLLLEPAAARLAAGRVNADALAAVAAELARLEALHEDDVGRYLDTDWALHDLVLEASGNMHLREVVNRLHDKLSAVRRGSVHPRMRAAIAELRELIDALRTGDAARAESAMRNHLVAALESRNLLFEAHAVEDAEIRRLRIRSVDQGER